MNIIEFHILEELIRQDQKWGADRTLLTHTWLSILCEETGEIAEAALKDDLAAMRSELIQAAAICRQIIEAIDDGRALIPLKLTTGEETK